MAALAELRLGATFERGQCSADDFAAGVVADWGLAIDGPAYLAEFAGWLGGPLAGAEQLVTEAGRVVQVGCLSNTNELHWRHWASWSFLDHLDHRFLSFELGLVKPDRELFEHVAARLQPVPPDRVLFLDDNLVNVEGARSVGFQGAHVRGPAEARAALVEHRVLR